MLSTIKNNEKFYLTFLEVALYTYCNPRKQKAFTPYSETEKSLGLNAAYFPVEKEVWNGECLFVGFKKEDDG